jgi:transposase InsO family protein
LWLSAIRDAFSRRVVAWETSARADADLVLTTLEYALASREVEPGQLIHHADHGCQGGFNGSSQHLIMEVLRGQTSGVDDDDDRASGDAFAWATSGPSGRRAGILGEDRRRADQRGRCRRLRRVGSGRNAVVPRTWRNAVDPAQPTIGQVPVVRGT